MSGLFSIITSVLLFILGLSLPLPPVPSDPDPNSDDLGKAALEFHRARQKRGLFALARLLLIVVGGLSLLFYLIGGLGDVGDGKTFAFLTGGFALLMLAIQRAERNRRLATFVFMGFCIWLVWRYAEFREYDGEAAWGIYMAMLLNGLFWLTLGKRYPVGSSKDIQVWGMDD